MVLHRDPIGDGIVGDHKLRASLSRIWPMGSQATMLKRELALLLLEDPEQRLRLRHCDEIMRCRLPGVYATSPTHLPGGQGGALSPIFAAISQDPSSQLIFRMERGGTTHDGADEFHQAVVCLDLKQLLDRCGGAANGGAGGPAGPGAIASCAAAGARQPPPQHGLAPCACPQPWAGAGIAPAGLPRSPFVAGTGGWVLGNVEGSLLRAVAATWPQLGEEDDDRLAAALAVVLVCRQEPGLPPCSLALGEVQAGLDRLAAADVRLRPLAAPEEAGAGGGGGGGVRIQALLAMPRVKGLLKLRSASGGGDVVTLCVEKLAAPGGGQQAEELLLPLPVVLGWARLLASTSPPGPAEEPRSPTASHPASAPPPTQPPPPPHAAPSPGLPRFLFEYETPQPHLPSYMSGGSVPASAAGRPTPQQQQRRPEAQRTPSSMHSADTSPGRHSLSGFYQEPAFNVQIKGLERQTISGCWRQSFPSPLQPELELVPALSDHDPRAYRQPADNGMEEREFQGQRDRASSFCGREEQAVLQMHRGYSFPGAQEHNFGRNQLQAFSASVAEEEGAGGGLMGSPEEYLAGNIHGTPLLDEAYRPSLRRYSQPGPDYWQQTQGQQQRLQAAGYGCGNGADAAVAPAAAAASPDAAAAGGLVPCSTPPSADAGRGASRSSLYSTSPNMLQHVPRAVASCWGAGRLGGEGQPRKVAEAHGCGAGDGGGQTPPLSPPSALDAACMALLAGSSLGSRSSGGPQMDLLFWPSTSPESGVAAAAALAAAQRQAGGPRSPDAPGAAAAAAAAAARSRRPSAPSAPGGARAASSTSDGSEDCGVHGPPDLETTLEALMSFDPLQLSLLSGPSTAMYNSSPYPHHPAAHYTQRTSHPSPGSKSFPAAGASTLHLGHHHMASAYSAPEPILSSGLFSEPQPPLHQDGGGRAGWAAVAAREPPSGRPRAGPQLDAPDTAVAAAAAWKHAAHGSSPNGPSLHPASGLTSSPSAHLPSPPGDRGYTNGGPFAPSVDPQVPGPPAPPPGPGPRLDQKLFPKTPQWLRDEIMQLLCTVPGLKAEDFDEGVLYQLEQKRSDDEARAALRTLLGSDVSVMQHPAAYLNHVIKNFHLGRGGPGSGAAGGEALGAPSLPSATVRANSVAVSSKAILQRLPLRLYRRLEDIVNRCEHLEWKHFDAGVVKVLGQLSELSDDDVVEELELLQATDLSAVEYMPAYLNKRLNNRLWSKRKQRQQQQQGAGVR